MSRLVPTVLAFTPLALLASFSALREEAPEREWEPEQSLTRSLAFELEFELVDVSVTSDGEELEIEFPERTQTIASEVTVRDEAVEVEDGRAVLLARSFETGDQTIEVSFEGESEEFIEESGLDGRTVIYSWDADDEEYGVEFGEDDADGDDELLEDLEFDIDLLEFLPDGDVEEGDTWSLDPALYSHLEDPAGSFNFEGEDDEEDSDRSAAFEDIYDNLEGEFEATFLGLREEDEGTFFVVGLEIDLEGGGGWEVEVDTSEAEIEVEVTQEIDVALSFDSEAELLWSVEDGRLHSMVLSGTVTLIEETTTTIESDEFSGEQAAVEEMEGEMRQSVVTE